MRSPIFPAPVNSSIIGVYTQVLTEIGDFKWAVHPVGVLPTTEADADFSVCNAGLKRFNPNVSPTIEATADFTANCIRRQRSSLRSTPAKLFIWLIVA
jgi:hypothetical protein